MKNFIFSLRFIGIMWAIEIIDTLIPYQLDTLGIYPRTIHGLIGILFAPFLHGDFTHLMYNTLPMFFLLFTLKSFYPKIASKVLWGSVVTGGALVWLLARQAYHIGASGLIYSLVAFMIAFGILQRRPLSIIISILIFISYGGLIYGVLPTNPMVSWEGHLYGAFAGLFYAYRFRNVKNQ